MNNIKVDIIYEDNHLLVVQKPVNILSQGDNTNDPDMLTLLKQDLKVRYNKPGSVFLGLLHRLDRTVGGTMIFAKTSKCASRISQQIRDGEFKKTYLVIVHGVVEKLEGTLINYLYKDKKSNMVSVVSKNHKDAKEAVLEYEVLEQSNEFTLLKINLITGRSHQIRVQLSNIGHPIFGDHRYGNKLQKNEKQIALWSNEIVINHPITNEEMSFKSIPMSVYPWNLFNIK